jgi:hypothetical protein
VRTIAFWGYNSPWPIAPLNTSSNSDKVFPADAIGVIPWAPADSVGFVTIMGYPSRYTIGKC